MGQTYRYIGESMPRKDAVEIVTGRTKYMDDVKFPDLLHAKILRSPHAHAIIKKIDKSRAERHPGVKAVLTWKDVPDWQAGTPRVIKVLDQKVRYVGDAVASVAAVSEDIARKALDLIDVEYDVLPAVFDVEEALEPDSPQLYEELPGNTVTPGAPILGPNALTQVVFGDVEKGFAEADVITEGVFTYENLPNALPPENPGVVALWEDPNKLTLWVVSQHPYNEMSFFSAFANGEVDVRVHGFPCGGGFGSRGRSWDFQVHAALLSKATKKHIKLVLSKEEHLAAYSIRIGSRMKAKVGMKKDGTVTAVSGRWLVDTGANSTFTQFMIGVGCGEVQLAVRCPNWDFRPVIVCTNRNPSGPARGFGGQELKCTLIPLLSLAMAKADINPFTFFRKNFAKPGDGYFWREGKWWQYRGIDFRKAMDKGAETFGWKEKWKGWLKPTAVDGAKNIGVGIGIHGNADIGEDVSEAFVYLYPNGNVVINSNTIEHGTGQRSNYMKMVAEVLQVPFEKVTMTNSDTMFNPYEFGPAGSRGTYAIGSAMIAAAEDARQKLLAIAAPKLEAEPDELDTADGLVFVKTDRHRQIPWLDAMGFDRVCTGLGRFEPDYSLSNFMMTFVKVQVDTETGKVTLDHVVNATDVGKIIDPRGIRGQLNACLGSAGIDTALFEETVLDKNTGRILSANMIDYKWRTFSDLPDIDHVILETPVDSHRFKGVGVGEVSTAPGPSAVLMAVSNAIGTWIHDYPLTPDKVLTAIELTKHRRK